MIEADILKLDPQAKRNGVLFVERFAPTKARFVRMTIHATNSAEPCLDELEIFTTGAKPENVALAARGRQGTPPDIAGEPESAPEVLNK